MRRTVLDDDHGALRQMVRAVEVMKTIIVKDMGL